MRPSALRVVKRKRAKLSRICLFCKVKDACRSFLAQNTLIKISSSCNGKCVPTKDFFAYTHIGRYILSLFTQCGKFSSTAATVCSNDVTGCHGDHQGSRSFSRLFIAEGIGVVVKNCSHFTVDVCKCVNWKIRAYDWYTARVKKSSEGRRKLLD